jgi:hypothetical protein
MKLRQPDDVFAIRCCSAVVLQLLLHGRSPELTDTINECSLCVQNSWGICAHCNRVLQELVCRQSVFRSF